MKKINILLFTIISHFIFVQTSKETLITSKVDKAIVFFQGVQLEHKKDITLQKGKQILVFEKITDFLDINSIQVKASGELTILSVSARKNFEDKRISNEEIKKLNEKFDRLELEETNLKDEYFILQTDKNLLKINSNLRGNDQGVKVAELKEAYSFIHVRLVEITKRESEIEQRLKKLKTEMDKTEQEIISQRGKPVINYSEILVEIDVKENTSSSISINYLSPNASWKPYYDLRSNGVAMPIKLESKAFVNQSTGIEWENIDLVLSTNDPYQNSSEPVINPWYLNYNNYPNQKYVSTRALPTFNFTGQKIRGEVIDASTGESLSFAKIAFSNNPNINVVSDFEGKFEITVPNGENYLNASFVGYDNNQQYINSPYIKFFLTPQGVELGVVDMFDAHALELAKDEFPISDNTISGEEITTIQAGKSGILNKKIKSKNKFEGSKLQEQKAQQQYAAVQIVQKDLRVEFTIQSKFSLKSDGFDQRVQIASNDLPSSYEYHSIPKIDPAVYLVAKISGWEKLNLLNGESNIYFDGTFIGKSYLDVNSTKDTLAFSLGKDAKIQVLRTKISEKSKNKISGNRQKTDIAWEIKIRNNGGAEIPMLVKDQFPISQNEDIKIKDLELPEGKKDENSGIITWDFLLPKNQSKTLNFSYTVDSQKTYILYVE